MSLPSSMADSVPCDRLLQKAYYHQSLDLIVKSLRLEWICKVSGLLHVMLIDSHFSLSLYSFYVVLAINV